MLKRAYWPALLLLGLVTAVITWLTAARSVVGQVTDAETGQPLPNATVSVAGRDARTDAQGRFELRGLRGLPALQVHLPGYKPLRSTLLAGHLLKAQSSVALRLDPVELRGTVVDAATRDPLAGATVVFGESQVQTDAQGRYVAKRLLPGALITARAPYYRDSDPVRYEGQAVLDMALAILPVTVTVRDLYSNRPLPGATVTADGETLQTDAQGQVSYARLRPQTEIRAVLAGYDESRGLANPGDKLVLGLRPSTVRGTVRGKDGQPVANALVLARAPGQEPRLAYTNASGEYVLEGVPPEATLTVRAAGYARVERQLQREPSSDFRLEPFVAKGIYFAFHLLRPSYQALLRKNLDLVDRTELNTICIEIKTETGWLGFQPQFEVARAMDAGFDDVIDVKALLADCKRRGIYTIARIPIFEDDLLSQKHPEWAIRRSNGTVWRAAGGRGWMDPFRKEVWDYNINIAKEAVIAGPAAIDAELHRLRPLLAQGGFLPALDDMASPDMPWPHYRYLIERLQTI